MVRTPLDWARAGESGWHHSVPDPANGIWNRHGDGRYLRLTTHREHRPFSPGLAQSLSKGHSRQWLFSRSEFFQSKKVDEGYSLPPVIHTFQVNEVAFGQKLEHWHGRGLQPLAVSPTGVDQAPSLYTHSTGCDFVRSGSSTVPVFNNLPHKLSPY